MSIVNQIKCHDSSFFSPFRFRPRPRCGFCSCFGCGRFSGFLCAAFSSLVLWLGLCVLLFVCSGCWRLCRGGCVWFVFAVLPGAALFGWLGRVGARFLPLVAGAPSLSVSGASGSLPAGCVVACFCPVCFGLCLCGWLLWVAFFCSGSLCAGCGRCGSSFRASGFPRLRRGR